MQRIIIQCSCGEPECPGEIELFWGGNVKIVEIKTDLGQRVVYRGDDFSDTIVRRILAKNKKTSEVMLD